ncbi:hypothetical protein I6H44_01690 [Aggregatibacter segnis]|jgi:hypothetical protein|uniref:Uncharacterized protein n=1 Tax=Aggregatibacter segnis ATCC 33393 TaxID=888057 RepID=E6KW67_9PAST|nr:hypothetical protein [Aggregatibacter segnis]EFU68526.1 conserved hypothetical protein [Aggregatibacter segnis ATCC 33393]QQB09854.1 hypothetical protein I6H44_01690 [Aggregatibacter segnis]SQH64375.1 Uncharacterised protein [Aggregatibacter segnis ATCC 33393]
MKALSIVALIFAAISIFIPVIGLYIAILCSLLALISFYSQPTLSGITIGINILSTIFLSPSLALQAGMAEGNTSGGGSQILGFYIGIHVICLVVGFLLIILRKIFSKKKVITE